MALLVISPLVVLLGKVERCPTPQCGERRRIVGSRGFLLRGEDSQVAIPKQGLPAACPGAPHATKGGGAVFGVPAPRGQFPDRAGFQAGEVRSRELPIVIPGSGIPGTCGDRWVGAEAKGVRVAVHDHSRRPLAVARVEGDPFENPPLPESVIARVLTLETFAEIRPSVVQLVAVDVIDDVARAGVGDEAVHQHHAVEYAAVGVPLRRQMPSQKREEREEFVVDSYERLPDGNSGHGLLLISVPGDTPAHYTGNDMGLPIIRFNSSTGSDTAASGAGPGDGTTGGSTLSGASNGSTNATGLIVTVPSADLTNVLTDGSHVIYLADATAGNRNFGKITAKANSGTASANVTVSDAF